MKRGKREVGEVERIQNRVRGILLGLAAGDWNGGPVQMALRLAESLAARGKFDAHDVGSRYLDWWREGAFDTGPTAAEVFEQVSRGATFSDAAQTVHQQAGGFTAGCNPAHRAAPLAMLPGASTEQVAVFAAREAQLTHWHPLAGDVSAAVVVLCRQLALGAEWDAALEAAGEGRLDETREALTPCGARKLSAGGFAPDVLAAASYFLQDGDAFSEALKASVRFAGPANYCPVLVGAIGGARWGAGAIGEACWSTAIYCRESKRPRRIWPRAGHRSTILSTGPD